MTGSSFVSWTLDKHDVAQSRNFIHKKKLDAAAEILGCHHASGTCAPERNVGYILFVDPEQLDIAAIMLDVRTDLVKTFLDNTFLHKNIFDIVLSLC